MRGYLVVAMFALVTGACGDNIGDHAPSVTGAALATDEDTPVSHTVAASDPDGTAIALTATAPAHGTVEVSGLRITYTPEADYSGADGFDVRVSNGTADASARIDVMVRPVNDAPTTADDSFAMTEDTPLVQAHAALLANDADVDGDALTIVGVSDAVNGTVVRSATDITFTPAADFEGTASYRYTVSDGAAEATATVTLAVGGVNDAPVATDDTAATMEDTPVDVATATLVANDTDAEGQTLIVTAVANPQHGTVSLAGTTVTFTPEADFSGSASFEYTVTDGAEVDTATVTVAVAAVDDPPIAVDDTASTTRDTPIDLAASALLANDIDLDGPALAITSVQNPVSGTVALAGTTITFTPDAGFIGAASFEYVAASGAFSDIARVVVMVAAVAGCGDGVKAPTEDCDDGNLATGDGCDAVCQIEGGWQCDAASPSVCTTICGDGMRVGDEACDDGDADDTDGCTTQCVVGVVCDAAAFAGGDRFAVDPATGHCFVSYDGEQTTFAQAQTACAGAGGYLATIASAAEQAVVASAQNPAEDPWIGAGEDANDTDDVFDWVTDEAWGFTAFAAGEPDDDAAGAGNGDCLHLANAMSQWADTACASTAVVGRICEAEPAPCGDSVLQTSKGETCDDGNTSDNDGCSATCQRELVTVFTFTGAAGNEPTVDADSAAAGLEALPVMSRGAGVTASSAGNAFSASGWTTDTALDATDYFSFTLTPAAGASITLVSLELDERRSNTGIRTWAVRSSLDGFAADLGTFNVPDDANSRTDETVPLGAAFAGLTVPVELRIYGYAAESTGGTWRIDNVEVTGFTTGP